jgi:hypothetical protein
MVAVVVYLLPVAPRQGCSRPGLEETADDDAQCGCHHTEVLPVPA